MQLTFFSLGSGSCGNCYYLATESDAIIIDCGVDDFFLGVNKATHERLLQMKIKHDFILRPGGQNGKY